MAEAARIHFDPAVLRLVAGPAAVRANAHNAWCGLTKLQPMASTDDTINGVSDTRRSCKWSARLNLGVSVRPGSF